MITGVFARYCARLYLRTVLNVFVGILGLIFTIDFVDTLRRAGDVKGAGGAFIAWLAVLHTPLEAEQVLPFVILIGSMATFLSLARQRELIVARAAGLSVWQFLTPALVVGLGLGIMEIVAFNPLATGMKRRADALEARLFAARPRAGSGFWLRQQTGEGPCILHIHGRDLTQGRVLGVQAYVFTYNGLFAKRVEAKSGLLQDGYFVLEDVDVVTPGHENVHVETYRLATSLTPSELAQTFITPDHVSFFQLPTKIHMLQDAGLETAPYAFRLQQLLAMPFSLAAMTLVAACFSLSLSRKGGALRRILAGLTAGFVVYIVTKIIGDMGNAGLLSAPVAAWSPVVGSFVFSLYVCLIQEDG